MIFFLPVLFALAGTCITLLFSNRIRQYKALAFKARQPDHDQVVVKGHTYSEAVDRDEKVEVESGSRSSGSGSRGQVENVRRVCIVGAGKEGAITGIVLAAQNPEVEFCVADTDGELIRVWNSDSLPFSEPGLEEMLFNDEALRARAEDETENEKPAIIDHDPEQDQHNLAGTVSIAQVERRRRLLNLNFSTDVHAALVPAELVFLCLEMDLSAGGFDGSLPHSYLDSTLQAIALATAGHKIIVQRSTAPYGATAYIRTELRAISSPNATYTVLANPALALPGSLVSSMLAPSSIILGHIFSSTTSTPAIIALKRLYASFVPEDRIVTMDAYSAELGAISAKAALVQQMISLDSVRLICDKVGASTGNVGWMLGCPDICGVRLRERWMKREVRCLVDLAAGLKMAEVKAYWEGVLKMERMKDRRDVRALVRVLKGGERQKKVALLATDVFQDRDMALVVLDELRRAEIMVRVCVDRASRAQIHDVLHNVSGGIDGIAVVDSLEDACAGCNAVVLNRSLGIRDDVMQAIADRMEEPKALLSLGDGVDGMKMRHLGFKLG
ncbi:hypothetical protein BDW75DRAFT_241670 [Aspergillus navahoensis]